MNDDSRVGTSDPDTDSSTDNSTTDTTPVDQYPTHGELASGDIIIRGEVETEWIRYDESLEVSL